MQSLDEYNLNLRPFCEEQSSVFILNKPYLYYYSKRKHIWLSTLLKRSHSAINIIKLKINNFFNKNSSTYIVPLDQLTDIDLFISIDEFITITRCNRSNKVSAFFYNKLCNGKATTLAKRKCATFEGCCRDAGKSTDRHGCRIKCDIEIVWKNSLVRRQGRDEMQCPTAIIALVHLQLVSYEGKEMDSAEWWFWSVVDLFHQRLEVSKIVRGPLHI